MAGALRIDTRQGSRFRRTITATSSDAPVNLTGYGIRMQVRRRADDSTALLSIALGDGITSASPSSGVFVIDVDAVTMSDVPASPPRGWRYDLELVPAGDEEQAFALLAGAFVVEGEVTR